MSVFITGRVSQAADSVCGDGVKEGAEDCDDGNLRNGDSCSSSCTLEGCGNGSMDANEQCDDGNVRDGDRCNKYCQIEFCGDRRIQGVLGEECDDGNGVSNDGCSAQCRIEGRSGGDETIHPAPEEQILPSTIKVIDPTLLIKKEVLSEAEAAAQFLGTPEGVDITEYLSREESIQLEQILQKLKNGRRLNEQERAWAEALVQKLDEARSAERKRYTDLLKQFIATPISSEVVDEKTLEKQRLVDVEVPVAITELQRAVDIIQRGKLQGAVAGNLAKLQRQGLSIAEETPKDLPKNLTSGAQPIEVFAALKTLKETTEKYATTDLPKSLEIIRNEAEMLLRALPIFEREYGLKPEDTARLLEDIKRVTDESEKQDIYRVVGAVNRFLLSLERRDIFSPEEITALEANKLHGAARAHRLADRLGRKDEIVTIQDREKFVQGLTLSAPSEYSEIFRTGTLPEQKNALLSFLATDDRLASLVERIPDEKRELLTDEREGLERDIRTLGTPDVTGSECDDSIENALSCTSDYLEGVEHAVRNRNLFTRLVGYLQDYFGIGNE